LQLECLFNFFVRERLPYLPTRWALLLWDIWHCHIDSSVIQLCEAEEDFYDKEIEVQVIESSNEITTGKINNISSQASNSAGSWNSLGSARYQPLPSG